MAFSKILSPAQRVSVGGVTVTVGEALTFTITVFTALHDPVLPVSVYVVVTLGFALTTDPLVVFKPDAGLHVYEAAPLAVMVTLPPILHIVGAAGLTERVGDGFTVTTTD